MKLSRYKIRGLCPRQRPLSRTSGGRSRAYSASVLKKVLAHQRLHQLVPVDLTDHASGVAIIRDVSRVFREQVANDLVYGVVPFLGQGLEHTPEDLAHVLFVIGDVEGQGILIRHGLQLLFQKNICIIA